MYNRWKAAAGCGLFICEVKLQVFLGAAYYFFHENSKFYNFINILYINFI